MAPPSAASRPETLPPRSRGVVPAAALATPDWTFWALMLWVAGILAATLRPALGMLRLRRLTRWARPVLDDSWAVAMDDARRETGVKAGVRMLESSEVRSPMTFGLWRPVIVLPETARGWSAERRRVVLLHELVHVRRADWLFRMMALAACSLHWFNPLTWVAARHLAEEQESACDEAVVALGTRPSRYAGHLVEIARGLTARGAPMPVLDMARPSRMETRVMNILSSPIHRSRRSLSVLVLLALVVLVPVVAAVRPATADDERDDQRRAPRTDELRDVLSDLVRLEEQLEPFEAQLQALEKDMQPIEQQLAGVEERMAPQHAQLETLEASMEPFHESLQAVERHMEPTMEQLREVEAATRPMEFELQALETSLRPYEAQLRELEHTIQPLQERLEEVGETLQPLLAQHDTLTFRMANLDDDDEREIADMKSELEAVIGSMREIEAEAGELQAAIQPLIAGMQEIHQAMGPIHEEMTAVHEQMEPVHEAVAGVHEQMEPMHEQMNAIHAEMEPLHKAMQEVHTDLEPFYEEMQELHRSMEPLHESMSAIHHDMQPIHQEMEQLHERLEAVLTDEIEAILQAEMSAVLDRRAPVRDAAERLADAVSVNVNDGVMRLRSSPPELRELVNEALGTHRAAGVTDREYEAARDRAVSAISNMELRVD